MSRTLARRTIAVTAVAAVAALALSACAGTSEAATSGGASASAATSVADFGTFAAHIRRVAGALVAAGGRPGDRVAYLGKNGDLFFELLFGAGLAGMVTVPLNWRLAAAEHAQIVADAAHAILVRDPRECTGNFFIDEEVLREEGVTDLLQYGGTDDQLELDIFLD